MNSKSIVMRLKFCKLDTFESLILKYVKSWKFFIISKIKFKIKVLIKIAKTLFKDMTPSIIEKIIHKKHELKRQIIKKW